MKNLKKHHGLDTLKARYGLGFAVPWMIGVILFFIVPLIQSIIYCFSDVKLEVGSMQMSFIGLDNFREALLRDADFTNNLASGLSKAAYSFPLILILSLILAILLNQKFRGRILFRALYFLPVIIATGVVIEILFGTRSGDLASTGTDVEVRSNMISAATVIDWLGLPAKFAEYLDAVISEIMNLVWNCGVQIVLWIAGMQTIPELLYEVAKVEGATKWEEFWFITFPMLSRVTILVSVYTIVELITSKTDVVMKQAYTYSEKQLYGLASSMLWMYFLIVGLLMGLLLFLYYRFAAKRWE